MSGLHLAYSWTTPSGLQLAYTFWLLLILAYTLLAYTLLAYTSGHTPPGHPPYNMA